MKTQDEMETELKAVIVLINTAEKECPRIQNAQHQVIAEAKAKQYGQLIGYKNALVWWLMDNKPPKFGYPMNDNSSVNDIVNGELGT